jgi:hypothetical protein
MISIDEQISISYPNGVRFIGIQRDARCHLNRCAVLVLAFEIFYL